MKKFIFIFLIICAGKLSAFHSTENNTVQPFLINSKIERPNPLWAIHKKNKNTGKKVVAAVCAFPLPFGVIGVHRIILGTKPYVPLIYIATFGGGFGVLPFIDFWVIILDKDINHYKENSHVFMWIENQEKKPETTNSYD
ncbi:MAG: hypothetical protein ABI448_04255 [Bacteroidia bacterium]